MRAIHKLLESLTWKEVPQKAIKLAKAASSKYKELQEVINDSNTSVAVWYEPYEHSLFLNYPIGDSLPAQQLKQAFESCGYNKVDSGCCSNPDTSKPYILIKRALKNSDVFGPIASTMQLKPNSFNKLIGGPNPLISTIAGSLLGAGLGYGGGYLAEKLLPEKYFDKGRLRRTTALAGALLGAAPGVSWGYNNIRDLGLKGVVDQYPYGPAKEVQASYKPIHNQLLKEIPKEAQELNSLFLKYADETGAEFVPSIPVDQFGQVIWNDLRDYGGFTQPNIAAATTGVLQAASAQKGTNLISPFDIARIGVGAGSGYLSSLFVGKVLGSLAGLKPEAQSKLQDMGIWAGALANTVPLLFGQ